MDLNPEIVCANEEAYQEYFKDYKNWHDIPLLNHTPLHELKDLSLVRFRGMIQDMFNPEIYLEKYEVQLSEETKSREVELENLEEENHKSMKSKIQNGKYRDFLVLGSNEYVSYNSESNVNGERRTAFVVSIPGINEWVNEIENNENIRRIQDKIKELNKHDKEKEVSSTSSLLGHKRQVIEADDEIKFDEKNVNYTDHVNNDDITNENRKKFKKTNEHKSTDKDKSSSFLSSDYLLNSPIPNRPSKACMIKIYSDFDVLTLNTAIEAIGFLSVDPNLDVSTLETEDADDHYEIQVANPPPSLIPRLHAIVIKELKHINPLLSISISDEEKNELKAKVIREDLINILTQCLFGDEVAADYLLSHLISRCYVQTELTGRLGHLPINLSNIPKDVLPEYTEKLYEILESILPASHYFPMTLENLNTIQFIPKKDYKTNRLTSGLLQLGSHTHLVIDETRLQTGKLESNGLTNVKTLSHLMKEQNLKYDFQYYDIDFVADIPVLILSEGKSMLNNNLEIPIDIKDKENVKIIFETLKAAKHYLKTKLNNIRKFLTIIKYNNFDMNPEDAKMIEDDFVEMRKNSASSATNKNLISSDTLHNLLILSRTIGLSNGKNILDKESWEYAKKLEELRRLRIENKTKRS